MIVTTIVVSDIGYRVQSIIIEKSIIIELTSGKSFFNCEILLNILQKLLNVYNFRFSFKVWDHFI